jgi:hypothetical protein
MKAIRRLAAIGSVIATLIVPAATAMASTTQSPAEAQQAVAPTVAPNTAVSPNIGYASTLTITPDAKSTASMSAIPYGTVLYGHNFTSTNNAFSASDSNGYFAAQVTFTSTWPMGWTFLFNSANPYVHYANSLVTEDANQYQSPSGRFTGYHDHHVEPVDYVYHSTVPVNTQGAGLQLSIGFTWKFRLPNLSGTANLLVVFNYTVTGPIHCGSVAVAATKMTPLC